MSRLTRTLAAVPLALALAAVPTGAVSSADPRYPDTIALPTGSMPEGISAGPRDTFFAGARADGAVYVGNARNGKVRTLVEGRQGEVAVGLLHDPATSRLWVAGGPTGDVTAYDARSGRVLLTVNAGEGRFLNDVAITDDAVYVTDSRNAELVVVPTPDGALTQPGTFDLLPLGAPYAQPAGFGANGIRVLPDGDLLLVSGGELYTVDPATEDVDVVEQRGRELTAGDGLVLDGSTLHVVNGFGGDEVVELALSDNAATTTFVRTLTDDGLDRPTTGALVAGGLYVVNGRFDTLRTRPDADVSVTRLELG